MDITLHIAFEASTGEAYVSRVAAFLPEALAGQETLLFTLHPIENDVTTRARYQQWARAFGRANPAYRLALENMRVMRADNEFMGIANVWDAVRALPEGRGGICWDMGHYAYQVATQGASAETLPDKPVLERIIHTHIHSLYRLDTHHPLEARNEPAHAYIRALKAIGYAGLYNLELEVERYAGRVSPREGLERSVALMGEWLK